VNVKLRGRDIDVNETVISTLNQQFTSEEKKSILNEAQGTTAWIYDFIKEICKEQSE
jgi:hypothetical protein